MASHSPLCEYARSICAEASGTSAEQLPLMHGQRGALRHACWSCGDTRRPVATRAGGRAVPLCEGRGGVGARTSTVDRRRRWQAASGQ